MGRPACVGSEVEWKSGSGGWRPRGPWRWGRSSRLASFSAPWPWRRSAPQSSLQVAVFVALALASLAVLRPVARRHLRTPASLRTGTAALVGARAVVLERVDGDGGQVKIAGEVWSARAYDDDEVIEPGTRVDVLKIDGATALVAE